MPAGPVAVAYYRTGVVRRGRPGGNNKDRQREAVLAYARATRTKIISEFHDVEAQGIAPLGQRRGFIALLDFCREHKVTVMLVGNAICVADEIESQLAVHEWLRSHGIGLVPVDDPTRLADLNLINDTVRQVLRAASRFEQAALAVRLREARERARRETCRSAGRKPVPPEVVTEALRLAEPQSSPGKKRSLRAIAQALAEQGMTGPSGGPYLPGSVAAMLKKKPSDMPRIGSAETNETTHDGTLGHDADAETSRLWSVVMRGFLTAAEPMLRRFGPKKPPGDDTTLGKSGPSPAAWADFVSGLRQARRLAVRKETPEYSRPALQALSQAVMALHAFLKAQPEITAENLQHPFDLLAVALGDLGGGRRPKLFEPLPRRRPKAVADQAVMAVAALALDEMVTGLEKPLNQAAARVARVIVAAKLPVRPRGDATLASTVRGWRERFMEGEGSVPEPALHVWRTLRHDLQQSGKSAAERVEWLLAKLRHGPGLHYR